MMTKYSILMLVALATLAFVTGCSDDDPVAPAVTTETFTLTIENVSTAADYPVSGVFNTPVGAGGPAPIFPGEKYELTFTAEPGDRLSVATMFVQSNDLFYAFDPAGLALFDAMGNANLGDVTASINLWDVGTEMNQWPGVGPDQAPRQSGADTGADDATATVRLVDDGYIYPLNSEVVRVTLTQGN